MNRHVFSGGSIHIDPGQAYLCAAEITKMDAPVNVAATVDIDPVTRLMVVKVEAYYTGNASSNLRLSVNGTQIVRNKTIAPYCTDTV